MNRLLGILLLGFVCVLVSCGGPEDSPKKGKDLPPPKKEVKKTTPKSTNTTNPSKTVSAGATPEELAKAKSIIASVTEEAIATVDAKKKFKMFCTTCHGITGDLNVNGAKDLTLSTISLEESVAQVYHGKGLMTPFKSILKDEEIVAVSKYIVTLRK